MAHHPSAAPAPGDRPGDRPGAGPPRSAPPRIGSVFSGYGGLDLAAEKVFGGRTVWWAENDPRMAGIYRERWPGAVELGDVTQIDWAAVPPIDVLAGGFPCVDIAACGRRRGLAGPQSGLWASQAEAIRALKPAWAVIENVAALLSTPAGTGAPGTKDQPGTAAGANGGDHETRPGPTPADRAGGLARGAVRGPRPRRGQVAGERSLGVVLADLAALGYDAAWLRLAASDVGACHQRRRVFLLAWPAPENPVRV
jgi:DNA (cytosine-5)-methyltransferase 1